MSTLPVEDRVTWARLHPKSKIEMRKLYRALRRHAGLGRTAAGITIGWACQIAESEGDLREHELWAAYRYRQPRCAKRPA